MSLVTDFLLLAASGAACFYCWALSKRLKNLSGAKDGLGAGIVALSQSADEMRGALDATKIAAEDVSARIERLLVEADAKMETLRTVLDEYAALADSVSEQAAATTQAYADTLKPVVDEARLASEALFSAIEDARKTAPAPTPEPAPTHQITLPVPPESALVDPQLQDDQPDDTVEVELDDLETNEEQLAPSRRARKFARR